MSSPLEGGRLRLFVLIEARTARFRAVWRGGKSVDLAPEHLFEVGSMRGVFQGRDEGIELYRPDGDREALTHRASGRDRARQRGG